jgi:hypothetical protein
MFGAQSSGTDNDVAAPAAKSELLNRTKPFLPDCNDKSSTCSNTGLALSIVDSTQSCQ